MNYIKYTLIISLLIASLSLVKLDDTFDFDDDEANQEVEQVDIETRKQNGLNQVFNAIKTLIYGEEKEKSYKDLFIDTSKSMFEQVDGANEQVTIDDMLRIFIQSVLILVANRRPDLIPTDFNCSLIFFNN